MPEQPRSIRSRQAIIEATADLIGRQGVSGTSVSDIIKASGTSTGAIYHHFGSKQEIIVETARQALHWPMTAIAEYFDNPASPADLFGYAVEALRFGPELGELLVQLGAGGLSDDELGRALRAEFSQLRDGLDLTLGSWARNQNLPQERVRGLAQMLVGLILGFATQRALVDDFDEAAYEAQGRAMLMAAVAG
ncbi:MAG: TetR/AcrR family transcriptional regulator [Propionibacteriaceae bacterium]|uniref:DNA-binding HTH domain, TetR-type n=1 Tax=Propionibacterium ruminifibrarum TaxID=1962131 RepID=A0A375I6J6_9ACTN|nr:TetR/AcrR family transcriptional regulator [Propionibacterium ruminifibrarum]MBE6476974.1 TetR/AcrR family transcriptional regulator [Propionibacteriaceae bacterium]SPF69140.1 DNA-binding HTH domain, TetR-type [Propionibacterium ruminifibrarum]